MDARLENFSDGFYRCLMRAYPVEFQQRFSEEMAQVYHALCSQVYQDSGLRGLLRLWLSGIWDIFWAAFIQWWQRLSKRRVVRMQANPWDKADGTIPLSPRQSLLAALPFLLFGLASLASRLEILHVYPASLPLWQILIIDPYLVFNWIILVGLGASILAGFPRWGFSYLAWALLSAWWNTNMGFYGHRMQGEIWLPFLFVVVVSLLIRRSLRPLQVIIVGLWRDLTLLPFGIFTLYTWLYMLADSNHNPYLVLFISATTLAACLGAWVYFRSASPVIRALALIGGLFSAVVIDVINNATWDFAAYYGLPEGNEAMPNGLAIAILVVFLVMLGLGWLTQLRQQKSKI